MEEENKLNLEEFANQILFDSLIELAEYSNSNTSKIKYLRENTEIISSNMIEFLIRTNNIKIFNIGGIFSPTNFFVKIDVPECLFEYLHNYVNDNIQHKYYRDSTDKAVESLRSTLAEKFHLLKLDKAYIKKYPKAFDPRNFKYNKSMLDLLLTVYPDQIFETYNAQAPMLKKLSKELKPVEREKYLTRIDISRIDISQLQGHREFYLESIPNILTMGDRFKGLLLFYKKGTLTDLDITPFNDKELDKEKQKLIKEFMQKNLTSGWDIDWAFSMERFFNSNGTNDSMDISFDDRRSTVFEKMAASCFESYNPSKFESLKNILGLDEFKSKLYTMIDGLNPDYRSDKLIIKNIQDFPTVITGKENHELLDSLILYIEMK